MNFCPNCGAPIEFAVPDGDDRKRNICSATGEIFYDNPRNVVGTIVEREGRILMCRRAIEPRLDFWTLPAGFLELGETSDQGAARETFEEAGVTVDNPRLFSLIDVTHIGQVHIFFIADMHDDHYAPGPESAEVRFVGEHEIDWPQLAFPSIHRALSQYFADRAAGRFSVHVESLAADDWKAMRLDREPRV
ncbi:NUDIX hydrolase [Salinisphaera sp. SPP-AMP-43]|uniref:NUDIX hydrolase n=1 Tax=Salinisphaera sp. SPP-AMP-43 TaxID=3121288 RepID=UPI003C6E28BA